MGCTGPGRHWGETEVGGVRRCSGPAGDAAGGGGGECGTPKKMARGDASRADPRARRGGEGQVGREGISRRSRSDDRESRGGRKPRPAGEARRRGEGSGRRRGRGEGRQPGGGGREGGGGGGGGRGGRGGGGRGGGGGGGGAASTRRLPDAALDVFQHQHQLSATDTSPVSAAARTCQVVQSQCDRYWTKEFTQRYA